MPESILKEKIDRLPSTPGVYRFRDDRNEILYVGKAKRLRHRVRSYFQNSGNHNGRIKLMISKISDVDVIITDSEAEALILENNLIKKHHPRYNIMYRDDKTYPYVCLTADERPRVFPTRTIRRDGTRYFGPYDHVGHMRRMLESIRKTFGLCTCAVNPRTVDRIKEVPKWHSCFDDYLDNCSGDWEIEKYRAVMENVKRMLNGKTEDLMRKLKDEMQIASDALDFEHAAQIRDSLDSLVKYNRKMKIVADRVVNRDLFALSVDEELGEACGVLFKIREGKLIGKFNRFLKNIRDTSPGDIMQSFVEDYYTGQFAGAIPDEVYVSEALPDPDPLLEYLWQQLGRKVPVSHPKIGEKKQLISMAQSNARLILGERKLEKARAQRERIPQSVKDLKEYLQLQRLPRRIECFDNSNIQGSDPAASMVCFVDAKPRKSEYKRFHIKNVIGADDYASMKEVVKRRYLRVRDQGLQAPDLIVIDGGKGQLNAALEALEEIGYEHAGEVVGLAKRLEELFLPGKTEPVMIPKTSSALKLLQQARDEAHRFAINFHKSKRSKRIVQTELTGIEGVGEKTARELIRSFGSVKEISSAALEELQDKAGIKRGESVYNYFQKKKEV
ncbi:MAG: excinuclease ABC subunit UvrC [Balneolaceae bacterium]